METDTPPTIFLKDYRPVPHVITHVDLTFHLDSSATRVVSRLMFRPNPACEDKSPPLALDGEMLSLNGIKLDGMDLSASDFSVTAKSLTIHTVPHQNFVLEIDTTCNPESNSALSGLYMSNGIYCTQCEAEGFRRITYFQDRPDVLARYTVRIEAPEDGFPVLLSNGNPGDSGPLPGNRHFAVWDDPFPKPSYLFALVAGDLSGVQDTFTTASGRKVALGIYVERGKEDRCGWAMDSLKTSMRWDETAFGREYDLDVFNIVAVPHFNMGAMENKGLNIFNDKYILARPDQATDTDYVNIESIIAHEYFHNWTGNRITCRDWFQLCLKEGLTVFRDQEFTSDIRSRALKRIQDVRTLRARQFPEDGGPLAHPVRPSSYIEINNFYTPTVYEKGAEICRMLQTLIGPTAFRKAMDLYFERHDGQAATVEDFLTCMADGSGRDLTQFSTWYAQAGTPKLTAEGRYNASAKSYDLTITQTTLPTPGQDVKVPLHMPLGIGLVGPDGTDLPLDIEGKGTLNAPVIEISEARQTFRFRNISHRPVLSLNRGFSAPVQLVTNATAEDELFLMGHDQDSFNRWESGQQRGRALILDLVAGKESEENISAYADALGRILDDGKADDAFKALMLALPPEAEIAAAIGKDVDPDKVVNARDRVRTNLGQELAGRLEAILARTVEEGRYTPDPASTARRSLRYAALALLTMGDPPRGLAFAEEELRGAGSMTAEIGALTAIIQVRGGAREAALAGFLERHDQSPLLVDKWLMLNAQCPGPDAVERVSQLTSHPKFDWRTPNRVYALISAFTAGNMAGFNAADGSGYRLVADAIITLDAINQQVAARVATGFRSCKVLEPQRREAALTELRRVLATPGLSPDSFEIVSRIVGR